MDTHHALRAAAHQLKPLDPKLQPEIANHGVLPGIQGDFVAWNAFDDFRHRFGFERVKARSRYEFTVRALSKPACRDLARAKQWYGSRSQATDPLVSLGTCCFPVDRDVVFAPRHQQPCAGNGVELALDYFEYFNIGTGHQDFVGLLILHVNDFEANDDIALRLVSGFFQFRVNDSIRKIADRQQNTNDRCSHEHSPYLITAVHPGGFGRRLECVFRVCLGFLHYTRCHEDRAIVDDDSVHHGIGVNRMRHLAIVLAFWLAGGSVTAHAAVVQIYVRAAQPTTSSYAPSATLAGRLGAGGALDVRITRTGVGQYSVSFGGALLVEPEGNVQVSANDDRGQYCKVEGWGQGSARIRCFAANGRPADAAFSLLATRASGRPQGVAYAWVSKSSLSRVASDYSYSEGGAVTVARTAPGQYTVGFPGALGSGGNAQVTAYGIDANYCNVGSWGAGKVYVRCYNQSGVASDSSFSVLATDSRYVPAGGQVGYLWGNSPATSDYRPDATYARGESDALTVRRRSPGWYTVTLGSIVTGGGGVNVTGYGSSARCVPAGWEGGSAVVRCFGSDGAPVDSRFSLLVTRAGPTRVLDSDFRTREDVPTMEETPTVRQRINVVEHLCINTSCEFGDEGWDKTASEMEYDGTDTTTFDVDVAGSRFVRLCPVRRRTTDREFAGNGPAVRANSAITQSGQSLQLSAFMEAAETGSGSSIAFKTWNGVLYNAPEGWRITSFDPVRSETSYTDSNHAEDTPPVRGGTLVSEFRFKGDTGGDDIGNCTTDDTYMTVSYNPVTVTLNANRADMRMVRIVQSRWRIMLETYFTNLTIVLNNYDRTKSQPENGTPENKYFIDRTDTDAWSDLTDAQVRQASYYEFRSVDGVSPSIPATPLPLPAIRINTITFLMNNIISTGRQNRVGASGDHIRLNIRFESNEPEVVAACVDNVACGTGEPHEAGKPILQVNNLNLIPYVQLRVDRSDGRAQIRAELTRIRMEADIQRDGVCRDNLFAFACGALAGDVERIVYRAVLKQLNEFVIRSPALIRLLNTQLTNGVCGILTAEGEDCRQVESIILDEDGNLLIWMRD